MNNVKCYPIKESAKARTKVNAEQYQALYEQSIQDPEVFWAEQGKRLEWMQPYSKIKDVSFSSSDLHIKWYQDGVLNASANCLDRHLADRADQTAIIYEGDDPSVSRNISYRELHEQTCKFANALKKIPSNEFHYVVNLGGYIDHSSFENKGKNIINSVREGDRFYTTHAKFVSSRSLRVKY